MDNLSVDFCLAGISYGLCFLLAGSNPGALFGLAAIGCWALMLRAVIALALAIARKSYRRMAALVAFLIGGFGAGTAIFLASRPPGFSLGETLHAAGDAATYGHPIEHAAENAICLSSYALLVGGALCAGIVLAATRLMRKQKTA